ncbi:MAG: hypothetical protein U9Q69_04000 [Nanoarchaeota archaeon]|nr:hypothetical protein [Nanoarchaeota archaeon]
MRFKNALVSALAGLVLLPTAANAKGMPEKKIPTKPIPVKRVDVNRYGKKIYRNELNVKADYTTLDLNGRKYETGSSFGIKGSYSKDFLKWLNLKASFDFNYQALGLETENGSERVINSKNSLEGRVKIYSSEDLRLFLGLGGHVHHDEHTLIFEGNDGKIKKTTFGPRLAFSLQSRYFDLDLAGDVLYGQKDASYDRSRDIFEQHISLEVKPRYWRFSLPIVTEVNSWKIADIINDRAEGHVKFNMQPTFDVMPHLSLFFDFTYHYRFGSEEYEVMEFGGGAKLKW